jgi:hypothetical protein
MRPNRSRRKERQVSGALTHPGPWPLGSLSAAWGQLTDAAEVLEEIAEIDRSELEAPEKFDEAWKIHTQPIDRLLDLVKEIEAKHNISTRKR